MSTQPEETETEIEEGEIVSESEDDELSMTEEDEEQLEDLEDLEEDGGLDIAELMTPSWPQRMETRSAPPSLILRTNFRPKIKF